MLATRATSNELKSKAQAFLKAMKDRDFEKEALAARINIAREEDIPASRHLRDWIDNHCAGKIPNLMPSAI